MVLLVHQSPYYDTPFTRYTARRNAVVIDQIFLQIELPEKRWTQRNYHHLNEYNLKVFMFEQMVLATNGITSNFGERVQTYSSSSSTYNQSRIKYLLSATFSIIFVFVHFLSFWRLFFSRWLLTASQKRNRSWLLLLSTIERIWLFCSIAIFISPPFVCFLHAHKILTLISWTDHGPGANEKKCEIQHSILLCAKSNYEKVSCFKWPWNLQQFFDVDVPIFFVSFFKHNSSNAKVKVETNSIQFCFCWHFFEPKNQLWWRKWKTCKSLLKTFFESK